MKASIALILASAGLAVCSPQLFAESAKADATIHSQPLHAGTINPMLFGNFIELLNDVVPGMWAEMLNDRSFEGVTRPANWCYYDGSLDICDRDWDKNPTWSYDGENPFNGARSARLAAGPQAATLTQSGLAVKKGLEYRFSGYFRSDNPGLRITVALKTRLPTDQWMTLASAKLPALSANWRKVSLRLKPRGGTDRVVFELQVAGQGHVWADKLSLMPGDNLQGWRPDVVEAVKELHPAIIRWGGSTLDPGQYRWTNSIGDHDHRTPFPNKNWGRIDSNDVGIDEFCQFCELTGVAPLICVSFSDGAQSAANLVEYCNGDATSRWGAKRAGSGRSPPYRVKHWQIGNEISGDNENYLSQFGAFVELMKRADPKIAILASYPTQKLLDRVGKDLAYIAPHHYTPDLEWCERDFTKLTEMLAKTPGCAQIKMAVTEWNISGGDWGLGRARQMTLAAALLNARYLHVLMRHSDRVEIACRSNLANSFCGAVIETAASGLGVLKRPSYYVMQLYARHAKPVPLRVEQAKAGPDIFACGSPDKHALVIFAVNSRKEPVEWRFGFEGFAGVVRPVKAEAVCDTLNAGQPDIMNHWETPERVSIVALRVDSGKILLPPLSATAIECEGQ